MLRTESTTAGDSETISTAYPNTREKREALEQVLQSPTFVRADQLRNFLRYICEMEIAGRAAELCEFRIGIEAFGRPADYSPIEDGIVRRRAVSLREKLHEVYSGELANAGIRIDLPKGRYVPHFVRVEPGNAIEVVSASIVPQDHVRAIESPLTPRSPAHFDPAMQAPRRRQFNVFWFAIGLVVGMLACLLTLQAIRTLSPSQAQASSSATTAALPPPPAPSASIPVEAGVTYEAEAKGNIVSGRTESEACSWCSGGNRIRFIGGKTKNYITMNNIVVSKSGNYEMVIYYVLSGQRSFFVSINDGRGIEVPLKGDNWLQDSRFSMTISLKAGNNHIRFYNDVHYAPDLDRIVIR